MLKGMFVQQKVVIIECYDASFFLDQWCKNLGKWKVEIPSVDVSIPYS